MRDVFVLVVVLGSLPMILQRPFIGVVMWTWLSYMNPHRLGWGFARDFPFAMLVALATLAGLLISKEAKKIYWTRETKVLAAFIIWMCITTVFAFRPDIASVQLEKVLKIQLMTFICLILLTDKRRIDIVIWTVCLSLGFYGIKGGIFTITSGGGYHVLGPSRTFIGGNNEIGLAFLMTLPLLRYLQLEARQRWLRLGLIGATLLTIIATLGTQSRGAFVGLAAIGVFFVWKSPKRFTFIILMLLAVPVMLAFMPDTWWERMYSIQNYEVDASAMGRIVAWTFAFKVAMSNFMGGGFEALTVSGMRDVHSIYFEIMSEHGFFGLGLYLTMLFFTWRSCTWVRKKAKNRDDLRWAGNLASMLQVSGIGFCSAGAFLGLAYFDLIYLLVALVVMTRVLVERELASADDSLPQVAAGKHVLRPERRPTY